MPRPLYIVCAQSSADDKESSIISIFNVVEKLQIAQLPTEEHPGSKLLLLWPGLRAVSAWMATADEDYTAEFESSMVLHFPGNPEPFEASRSTFRFESQAKPTMRFTAKFETPPTATVPGILRVEQKIRRVGSVEWLSHDYPIIIDLVPTATMT
jgi:hypothetical protein